MTRGGATGSGRVPGPLGDGELGAYVSWIDRARAGSRRPGWMVDRVPRPDEMRRWAREILGPTDEEGAPAKVRVESSWAAGDGVLGEVVSWDLGYGPRTEAYVLRPDQGEGPWPGVVALHCHGGFTFYGKEKIADGPAGHDPVLDGVRERLYAGRAYVNDLARRGFVVLAHDVFAWGSRKFDLAVDGAAGDGAAGDGAGEEAVEPSRHADAVERYNAAAAAHEHVIEKYCRLLGTTFAAVVAFEDRAALAYLAARGDVAPGRIGCVGLSGGGARAAMLQATSDVAATVVVAMMSSYGALLDRDVARHTWMLYPERWPAHGDWPDLVACRPTSPLLVQYRRHDELFSVAGMEQAHARIAATYAAAGNAHGYDGQFYDGPHGFDAPMQEAAFAWLARELGTAGPAARRSR